MMKRINILRSSFHSEALGINEMLDLNLILALIRYHTRPTTMRLTTSSMLAKYQATFSFS